MHNCWPVMTLKSTDMAIGKGCVGQQKIANTAAHLIAATKLFQCSERKNANYERTHARTNTYNYLEIDQCIVTGQRIHVSKCDESHEIKFRVNEFKTKEQQVENPSSNNTPNRTELLTRTINFA